MIRATKKTGEFEYHVTVTGNKEDEADIQSLAINFEKVGFLPAHRLYFTPTSNGRIRLDYVFTNATDMCNFLKVYQGLKYRMRIQK